MERSRGSAETEDGEKELKVTIPEGLQYFCRVGSWTRLRTLPEDGGTVEAGDRTHAG